MIRSSHKRIPRAPLIVRPHAHFDVAAVTLSPQLFYSAFAMASIIVAGLLFLVGYTTTCIVIPESAVAVRHQALARHTHTLTRGYPIETMSAIIAKRSKKTAEFLVGIAKKESNWGKRVPRADDGSDCYNYWGYRGEGSRGIAMGHGCFASPEEAIGVVGGRIDTFVREYKFDTPQEMVVWKCGWSCEGQNAQSVKKWIADVGYYVRKMQE